MVLSPQTRNTDYNRLKKKKSAREDQRILILEHDLNYHSKFTGKGIGYFSKWNCIMEVYIWTIINSICFNEFIMH